MSPTSFLGRRHVLSQFDAREIVLWVTPLGEDSWFLRTLPHVPFPLADSALYPFTGLNLRHEDEYMLSPVSPPDGSLNLGAVSGTRPPNA